MNAHAEQIRPDDLVKAAEAAKMADRSKSSIRAWVRDGKLTGYRSDISKPNSPLMVSKTELIAFLSINKAPVRPKQTGRPAAIVASIAKLDQEKQELVREIEVLRKENEMLAILIKKGDQLSESQAQTIRIHESTMSALRADIERMREDKEKLGNQLQQTMVYLTLPWWKRWSNPVPMLTTSQSQ